MFLRVDLIPGTDQSVASVIDITSLKRAEKSLARSESRLSGIVDAFEGLVYTVNPGRKVTYINALLKKLLKEDPRGHTCHRSIFGLDAPCPWCNLGRIIGGETVQYEVQNPMDNRWNHGFDAPAYDAHDKICGKHTVLLDIHDRKTTELSALEQGRALERENRRLRAAIGDRYRFGDIIGKSPAMQKVYGLILKAAATDANAIIYGESGTGKELVARAIHDLSERKDSPFVPVNCGAIPKNLMETEFFGHVKGAFTSADRDRPGLLDQAAGGTVFLDELGEIGADMQVKLLRVLEGHGFTPVGGRRIRRPDVRFVSATNKNLAALVDNGRIREDFFYRVHVIPVSLPPLRDRREDIPLLVEHFLKAFASGGSPELLGGLDMRRLLEYSWPGNVRELENTLQRWVNLKSFDFPRLSKSRAQDPAPPADYPALPLKEAVGGFERDYILDLLRRNRWNRSRVAAILGIQRKTLYLKMKSLGIKQG